MSKVWAWVAGIVIAVALVGLLASVRAPEHRRGAILIIRPGAAQQAESTAPRGGWLLIRRIPQR
jgi:hypothetical protein